MERLDLVIKGGLVVTPAGTFAADVGIKGGKIAAISDVLPLVGEEVIEARGKWVLPGAIDVHTHFAHTSGGRFTSDDFFSGSLAAACGGVTAFVDFAIPRPGARVKDTLRERIEAAREAVIDHSFHGVMVDAETAEEAEELAQEGVTSFKLFMTYRADRIMAGDATLRAVLEASNQIGGLAGVHAENDDLVETLTARFLREGKTGMPYHALSRPSLAEREAVARACLLAEDACAPVYIFHLSSAAGLREAERARVRGVRVWVETCPHYLVFTEEVYQRPDAYKFLMSPPLRSPEDREALWRGLAEGSVQVVASDHCPYSLTDRLPAAESFRNAPPGVGGTEMLLTVLLSEGVAKGRLSLERVAQVVAWNPARIFGLWPQKGHLGPGADADLVVVDPGAEWVVRRDELHTRCDYSIYEGMKLRGRVVVTVARGQVIHREGEFLGQRGQGRYLHRRESGLRRLPVPL